MGEAILKKYVDTDSFYVTSAGIGALEGNEPTRHAVLAMKKLGHDIVGHRAKHLTAEIVDKSDLILVMEQNQKEYICNFFPGSKGKTFLLTDYASGKDIEVEDPMGRDSDFYLETAKTLDLYLQKVAQKLSVLK